MLTVVAAVIRRENLVLLSRRLETSSFPGLWEFPGGKVEVGESHDEALQREVFEELAVTIEVFDKLLMTTHQYETKAIEIHFFRCEIIAGELQRVAVADFRWVDVAALQSYNFPSADRDIVSYLMKAR